MLISDMYPSKYLKAADVGRSRKLTVREVRMEEVGLCSADTADWVGKQLVLHVEAVHYAGRSTPGIRIRGGASPAQAGADDLDRDQVPF